MAIIMIIEHSGKTYEYPLFDLNTVPANEAESYYVPKSVQYLIPLYSFLELPRTETTISCKVNDISGSLTINKVGNMYSGSILINGKKIIFSEPIDESPSNLYQGGTCFGYNYYNKKFVYFQGSQKFMPINNSSAYPHKCYYNEDYGSGYEEMSQGNLKANSIYKGLMFGTTGANYTTCTVGYTKGYDEFFRIINTKIPTYPDYPDDEPDPPIPGNGDDESDPIPDPPILSTWDVTNTGFVVIYNPTVQEIRELAYFMWSGDFTDLIKKMFASPFEALISLKMIYCPVITGAAKLTVWLGNVETTVSMSKVVEQFADIDMGTINIAEYFGSFADYAPYTKIQIYLPFIGYKDLNVDEVMNAALHLRYRVDVYTGSCIAYLTVTKNIKGTALNSILYQFDGNCACEIPFTSNDNSRYVSALLTTAASTALSMAATSGVSAAEPAFMFDKGKDAKLNIGSLAPVANGMLDVLSTKPNIQRAGSLTGSVAAMCIKTPYVIIRRPIAQMPKDYQHYLGIPLNLSMQLSSVTGYTIVSQIFLSSATATDKEIEEITQLLKSGVIL